ncbi:hypothetical protein TYRP_007204 [Tyrophagus putrescentiae]|nr:hypothetical protein TYRP_007204 [Tyrophagus putrescentiae]
MSHAEDWPSFKQKNAGRHPFHCNNNRCPQETKHGTGHSKAQGHWEMMMLLLLMQKHISGGLTSLRPPMARTDGCLSLGVEQKHLSYY